MLAVPLTAAPNPLTLPAGMRATRAVQALLRLLPHQPLDGWTEQTVEGGLHAQGVQVNRVTIYRALDRLVQAGLLQRTVDTQRLTRYWVVSSAPSADQTQLACTSCHQHFEVDANAQAVQAALLALRQALVQSTGVQNPHMRVAVAGECAQCAHGISDTLS